MTLEAKAIVTADAEPAPPSKARAPMLSVEVLRGFAALAVVFYHTHLILLLPEYGAIDVFGAWSSRGWLGVNFFFVLSGFIIFYAHRSDIGRPQALARYAWRRVIRIYPMYWIATTLYVTGAVIGFGYPNFAMNPWNLAWGYSLIAMVEPLTLPLRVAWTLFYEVQFYLMFALLLVSRRLGVIAFCIWFGAIFLANVAGVSHGLYVLHVWNFYFLVGMLINFGITRLKGWQGVAVLAVGVAAVLILTSFTARTLEIARTSPMPLIALAIAFGLIILGAIVCERRWGWKPHRLLLLLGSASYSIYLFHSPVISILAQANAMFGRGRLPPELLFVVISVVSTGVGVIAHLLVERPLLGWLRRFEVRLPILRGARDATRTVS